MWWNPPVILGLIVYNKFVAKFQVSAGLLYPHRQTARGETKLCGAHRNRFTDKVIHKGDSLLKAPLPMRTVSEIAYNKSRLIAFMKTRVICP